MTQQSNTGLTAVALLQLRPRARAVRESIATELKPIIILPVVSSAKLNSFTIQSVNAFFHTLSLRGI